MSKSDESDIQIKTRTNCKLSLFFLHFIVHFQETVCNLDEQVPFYRSYFLGTDNQLYLQSYGKHEQVAKLVGYVCASLLLIYTLYVDWAFSTNQKSLGKLVNG
uniref:Uncharacterized protein n=1 Tax=Oryza meridionalis TaxID=40149 RepID=A0A0E0BZ53_9ORYZ